MNTQEHPNDRLILPGAAARMFGVTTKCLREWEHAGKITAQRTFGGHRRYSEAEVRAHVANLKTQSETAGAVA